MTEQIQQEREHEHDWDITILGIENYRHVRYIFVKQFCSCLDRAHVLAVELSSDDDW